MEFWRQLLLGSLAAAVLIVGLSTQTAAAQTQTKTEYLSLCEKCPVLTIISKSGIGTAHAVAKAHITYQDARDHCEQWRMSSTPDCDKAAKETLKQENGKVYTASADCIHGKLTIADGESFVYAGVWPAEALKSWDSFMKGRPRWRVKGTGEIVGFNGPTRAPMVDATSRVLCPNGIGGAGKR